MESDTRSDQEKAAASQSGLGEAGTSRFANGTGSSPSIRRVLFPPLLPEGLAPQGEQCPQCARQAAYCRYPRDTLRNDYRFFKQD